MGVDLKYSNNNIIMVDSLYYSTFQAGPFERNKEQWRNRVLMLK